MTLKKIPIYNLEFPPYVDELHIGDYIFQKADDYATAYGKLANHGRSSGSEFSTQNETGSHQITAYVVVPEIEQEAVLPWGQKNPKQLDDILLLLCLGTRRSVFAKNWEEDDVSIIADSRMHQWGSQLLLSIDEWVGAYKDTNTGKPLKPEEVESGKIPMYDVVTMNIGFEINLNKILELISTKEWRSEYQNGYFLFLLNEAFKRQPIEKSFTACWTIWEQIFSLKNSKWLPEEDIFKMSADKKIAYILNSFFSTDLDDTGWRNIKRLTRSRNRLVHFGRKTEDVNNEEKAMFIRLTEQLVAKILGLKVSNALNSIEGLEAFLKKNKSKSPQ